MKRIFAIFFCVLILGTSAISLSGCGCSNKNVNKTSSTKTNDPSKEIIGNWGGRSDDVEVEFNEDETCEIGGIAGTYKIDNENTLTVTPNSENENDTPQPMVFEYYSGDNTASVIPSDKWKVGSDTLYINGYQYSRQNTNSGSESLIENSTNAKGGSSSKNNSSNNSNKNNSSSKTNSSENESSNNTENSSKSDNTNSNSGSSKTNPNDEDEVAIIYQNLDDFFFD